MIEWVVQKLFDAIPLIDQASKEKRELADGAYLSISTALTETCLYVAQFNKTREPNFETQARLAKLWAEAAIPLRHIDSELSEICEYKSEYWVDPQSWDSSNSNSIEIDLVSVRNKYRAKLN